MAAAAGPLLGGAALLPDDAGKTQRLAVLEVSAQGLATAIDAEIARQVTALATLAASPHLDRPLAELQSLDSQARATATALGAPVAVADAFLLQLTDTAVPYGTPLSGLDDTQTALQALESGTAAISGQALEMAGGRLALTLAVPARRNGENVAVVTVQLEVAGLGRVLGGMARRGVASALIDRTGRIVAATAPASEFPAALGRAGGPQPPTEATVGTTEGAAPFDYALRSPQSLPGWSVITAMRQPTATAGLATESGFISASLAAVFALLAAGLVLRRRPVDDATEELLANAEKAHQAAAQNEAEALRSLAELKSLHDTIPVGLGLLDRELHFLSVNARLAGVAGIPGAGHVGRQPSDVLPASIAGAIESAHGRVLATGRPVLEVPLSAEAPGAVRNIRHLLASCHPVHDGQGRMSGVSLVLQDVTERVRAEKGRELLVRELNHRVKNTLATVQSIVAITLRRTATNPQQLGVELGARLRALACAHDLLTAHSWGDADLADVIQAALKPWLDSVMDRIILEGHVTVLLRPTQAQAVVLALHELATNATKYGALSREEGHIRLAWRTDADGVTTMDWVEAGGPTVVEPPPEKRGFGTRLLERALASDLGAGTEVQLVFAPSGMRARISFMGAKAPGLDSDDAPPDQLLPPASSIQTLQPKTPAPKLITSE